MHDFLIRFCRHEFKTNHGEWVAKVKPQLTCTVEARVERAVFTPSSAALRSIAGKVREELRTVMDTLLKACSSPSFFKSYEACTMCLKMLR